MNKEDIIQEMVAKIISLEQEYINSSDAEDKEIRGRVVNSILEELDGMVTGNEN